MIKKDLLNETQRTIIYKSFFEDTDMLFLKNIIYIQHNIINNFKNAIQDSSNQIDFFVDDVSNKINIINRNIDVMTFQKTEYLNIIKELIDKLYNKKLT